MRIAVFESIVTPAGHEHDFDKMLVSELKEAGHQVEMYVPENYPFKLDYEVPVKTLPGEAVSYAGASRVGKMFLAAKREIRRLRWYDALYASAVSGAFDAIVVPTATYRFLRSLRLGSLRKSPVPVIFIVHGVNAGEAPRFFEQVEALSGCRSVKIAVITLGDQLFDRAADNVVCLRPPVFPPAAGLNREPEREQPLTLGFFGQYRREKNLEGFLQVFDQCRFTAPVKLFVQGATVLPEDAADFERIRAKYAGNPAVEFLHKALIGPEWHQAIAGIDALIMPYASPRYRYHWAAMLFTAIGFKKPVVAAESINPEVLAEFDIGVAFNPDDPEGLKRALENFVNTYAAKKSRYGEELDRANALFSPRRFVAAIVDIAVNNRAGGE